MSTNEREGADLASNDPTTASASPTALPPARLKAPLATVAALAVIAASAVVIVEHLPPQPWLPSTAPSSALAPAPARTGPTPSPIEPATLSRLSLVKSAASGSPTVVLGRPVGPRDLGVESGLAEDILFRELIRQAVLLAARDERGLATRDELIDDALVDAPEDAPGLVVASPERCQVHRMELRPIGETQAEPLTSENLDIGIGPWTPAEEFLIRHLNRPVTIMEQLSRTKIPAVLDGLGVKGEPNKYNADAAVPPGVEEKLETLGLVDHFQAVRELHEAIRVDGESPARLGALTRSYAQLAALTAHLWNPAHLAFEARAWLYAERMVARDPKSSWALRHRAFVGALNGVHHGALRDLKAAAAVDTESPNAPPAPAWVEVIDAAMKYGSSG